MLFTNTMDGSYFKIESRDLPFDQLSRSVMGLTVTEQLGGMTTGTVDMKDDENFLSGIIKKGNQINIEWGYADTVSQVKALIPNPQDVTDIVGPAFRTGMVAIVGSCNGGSSVAGGKFSFEFKSNYALSTSKRSFNHVGTKGSIVFTVLTKSGVLPIYQYVNFPEMVDVHGPTNPIKQTLETDFQFLSRLAKELKCVLQVGQDPLGNDVAYFMSPEMLKYSAFNIVTARSVLGTNNLFTYRSGGTVIDYTYKDDLITDGSGGVTQFALVGGFPITTSFQQGEIKQLVWELDLDKYTTVINKITQEQGVAAAAKFQTTIALSPDFRSPEIQRYWTPVERTTAPDHSGKSATIRALGRQHYSPGNSVKLGVGFPDNFRRLENLTIQSVTHSITDKYICTIEVKDFLGLTF